MLPRVVIYNAVSVDGRITGFTPDLGRFYGLVPIWNEDATLVGSETILAAVGDLPEEDETSEAPQSDDTKALLVVVDSRGRVRVLHRLKTQPYWRDAIALCSSNTPPDHLDYLKEHDIDYLVVGEDHVDLRAALEELAARYAVKTVRVDSGGVLGGVLLRAGLVDEVSLLVHPALVGGTSPSSIFRAPDLESPDEVISLKLIHLEQLDGDLVWLRYEVAK